MIGKIFRANLVKLVPRANYKTAKDLSTTHRSLQESQLGLNEYQEAAENTLEELSERFENLLESRYDDGADISLSAGVLTVTLDDKNTYVINKQTPNRQLWLSSPISGPMRFDYISGRWVEKRSQVELRHLLSDELSKLLKVKVEC